MKKMRIIYALSLLLLIATLSLFFVACNNGDSAQDGRDEVYIDESGNEYVLSDDGDGYDIKHFNAGGEENIVVPTLFNGLPVKNILANSFKDCSSVKAISVPNGINVKDDAFYGCSKLETLSIPEIDYAVFGQIFGTRFFDGAEQTTQFRNGSPTKFYIPCSLTSVELTNAGNLWNMCFCSCESIVSIRILGDVEEVGVSAFESCISLKNISLPNTIKQIDFLGIAGCASLQHIELPSNLEVIDISAFRDDTALEEIVIPNSVRELGQSSFEGCSSLKEITIGEGVKTIGFYAFSDCYNVDNLYFNAKNAYIYASDRNRVFANLGKNTSGTIVHIGASVEAVPSYLLYADWDEQYCPNVTEIVFAEGGSCKSIGDHAFTHLQNLTDIVLVDGLEVIGSNAFWYCTSLEKVIVPKTVMKIKAGAFSSNENLKEVEFEGGGAWKVYIASTYFITISVGDSTQNASYFVDDYRSMEWEKA